MFSSAATFEHRGSIEAYTFLRDIKPIPHWGPAFYTKFLYFVGQAVSVRSK